MNDWRGTEVKIGDRVVYPGRQGSNMWTIEAEVVEVLEGNPNAEDYWDRTPHALRVRRLRQSDEDKIKSKVVLIKLKGVTVVETAEALELGRYLYFRDSDIEIDGRAT